MTLMYPGDGQETSPKGVRGGLDGQLAERWHIRGSGEKIKLPNAAQIEMKGADRVIGVDCSGGGYGSPLEREPKRVLNDVLELYETPERAEQIYGVILTGDIYNDTLQVDFSATEKRRRELASS